MGKRNKTHEPSFWGMSNKKFSLYGTAESTYGGEILSFKTKRNKGQNPAGIVTVITSGNGKIVSKTHKKLERTPKGEYEWAYIPKRKKEY